MKNGFGRAVAFLVAAVFGLLPVSQAASLQKLRRGNPDQPWGTKRAVADTDRAEIARYRLGQHGKPERSP